MPTSWPTAPAGLPRLTTDQMRSVDRLMTETYGIALLQMMEHAGRLLAVLARELMLAGQPEGRRVVVLAGTGGNGGGAMVAARRLHGWGAAVTVVCTRPAADYAGVPARQRAILARLGVPIRAAPPSDVAAAPPAVVLDGLIGYSLQGSPRGAAADLIRWTHTQPAPVVALDVPSGLDATTGRVYDPAVQAAATLTLALPKQGLFVPEAAAHVGQRFLADIGVPPALYAALGLHVGPVFAQHEILRLVP